MKEPIIIVENGDIMFFETVEAAKAGVEPIDVINGEYVAYDRDGNILKIIVIKKQKNESFFGVNGFSEMVNILDQDEIVCNENGLRESLLIFFKKTDFYDKEDDNLKLTDLVDKAIRKYGYSK